MAEWVQGRLVLRGRVQGVGYRYFVLRKAGEFDVTGLVRNLSTGEVEVIAEGKKDEVEQFFEEVKQGPVSAYVTSYLEEWSPFSGFYSDFRVGY
ncbi:MAG TPA: acylphosphatase [Candidatus Atribacteria bacterium]|nr:acylphosphatase [Candidatus Atribacteria bacterium]